MNNNYVMEIPALRMGLLAIKKKGGGKNKVRMAKRQVASVCFRTKFRATDVKIDALEPQLAFLSEGVSTGVNRNRCYLELVISS